MERLRPQLLASLADYSGAKLAKDLTAGVIVAIIALPLSIALALASGVSPEQGLYTAIAAGFVISALGGSTVQIAGPMFFGAVEKIPRLAAGEKRRVMILRMRSVPALDITALNGLRRLWEECRSRNIRLLFSHLNPQPLSVLEKSGLYAEIGPESFLPNIDEALAQEL